jgi:hypothetical protein
MGEWTSSGADSAAPSPGPPERKKTGSGSGVGPVAGRRTIRRESFRPERVPRSSKTSYVPHRASPPLSGKVQGESLPCHLRDLGAGADADADAAGEMALEAAGASRALARVATTAAARAAKASLRCGMASPRKVSSAYGGMRRRFRRRLQAVVIRPGELRQVRASEWSDRVGYNVGLAKDQRLPPCLEPR